MSFERRLYLSWAVEMILATCLWDCSHLVQTACWWISTLTSRNCTSPISPNALTTSLPISLEMYSWVRDMSTLRKRVSSEAPILDGDQTGPANHYYRYNWWIWTFALALGNCDMYEMQLSSSSRSSDVVLEDLIMTSRMLLYRLDVDPIWISLGSDWSNLESCDISRFQHVMVQNLISGTVLLRWQRMLQLFLQGLVGNWLLATESARNQW